jgi:hypothetical protein
MGFQVSLADWIANSIGWEIAIGFGLRFWALDAWTERRSRAHSAGISLSLGTDLLVSFILSLRGVLSRQGTEEIGAVAQGHRSVGRQSCLAARGGRARVA